jgi:hypothetical protein
MHLDLGCFLRIVQLDYEGSDKVDMLLESDGNKKNYGY